MNLEEWSSYLADVPHLLGNMPWDPRIGMYVASKGGYIPHQEEPTTYYVKDFYPVVRHKGQDPSTYVEYAKDEGGYAIFDEDSEGNTHRREVSKPMPSWIERRMDMAFEGGPVYEDLVDVPQATEDYKVAGWTYVSNGHELMDYDHERRSQLEQAALQAYDSRQTLYVLATTFTSTSEHLDDDNWWLLFALVPIYPYARSNDVVRDYRLVSISPYSQLSIYDDQRTIKKESGWQNAPNLNFEVHQKFDSKRLRSSVRSAQASDFTPTAQTISKILNDSIDAGCKVWYKISPFPGMWQSINTQFVGDFPVPKPPEEPSADSQLIKTGWDDDYTASK